MVSKKNNDISAIRVLLAQNQLVFRALGDVARQDILLTLAEVPTSLSVGELAKQTKLSRPAVSHHLRILKDAGLLMEVKRGVKRYYRPTFLEVIANMKQLTKAIHKVKGLK